MKLLSVWQRSPMNRRRQMERLLRFYAFLRRGVLLKPRDCWGLLTMHSFGFSADNNGASGAFSSYSCRPSRKNVQPIFHSRAMQLPSVILQCSRVVVVILVNGRVLKSCEKTSTCVPWRQFPLKGGIRGLRNLETILRDCSFRELFNKSHPLPSGFK